uniref:hypothetical protein n=1 Tax=Candidatus Electrothrix sp. TaxID=2170559 RepID=UPI004057BD6D
MPFDRQTLCCFSDGRIERRWWMSGSFMIRYSPRIVGAGPRACPVAICRDGGQTGRTQGSAPTGSALP